MLDLLPHIPGFGHDPVLPSRSVVDMAPHSHSQRFTLPRGGLKVPFMRRIELTPPDAQPIAAERPQDAVPHTMGLVRGIRLTYRRVLAMAIAQPR
jgi:hypothetical protein